MNVRRIEVTTEGVGGSTLAGLHAGGSRDPVLNSTNGRAKAKRTPMDRHGVYDSIDAPLTAASVTPQREKHAGYPTNDQGWSLCEITLPYEENLSYHMSSWMFWCDDPAHFEDKLEMVAKAVARERVRIGEDDQWGVIVGILNDSDSASLLAAHGLSTTDLPPIYSATMVRAWDDGVLGDKEFESLRHPKRDWR